MVNGSVASAVYFSYKTKLLEGEVCQERCEARSEVEVADSSEVEVVMPEGAQRMERVVVVDISSLMRRLRAHYSIISVVVTLSEEPGQAGFGQSGWTVSNFFLCMLFCLPDCCYPISLYVRERLATGIGKLRFPKSEQINRQKRSHGDLT